MVLIIRTDAGQGAATLWLCRETRGMLVKIALGLLRLAGEVVFFSEVNRFLGRIVGGCVRYRRRSLAAVEAQLLRDALDNGQVDVSDVDVGKGLSVHTICARSEGDVRGPVAVLVHGHSMSGAFFCRNFQSFLDMGYRVVYAPTLVGWGGSSTPVFEGENEEDAVEFYIDALDRWICAVGLAEPGVKFSLCGHSLGSYLAHEYLVRFPHRVDRLILTSPAAITRHIPFSLALWFASTPQRLMAHGGLISLVYFLLKYPQHAAYNLPGLRDLTLYSNSIAHRSGDAAAAALLRFTRVGKGLLAGWRAECVRPLLERVCLHPCRIELIVGSDDVLVSPEAVRALHRAMLGAGNDVKLSVISGADHSPHIYAPDLFAKAVMRGMRSGFFQDAAGSSSQAHR